MNAKKALVVGVSGQDGAYLSQLLLDKGYEVIGTSRDAQAPRMENLQKLGIVERVKLESMSPTDFRSVFEVLSKWSPDEVYNLAAQSHVRVSFDQPIYSVNAGALGTLRLLEAIRSSASTSVISTAAMRPLPVARCSSRQAWRTDPLHLTRCLADLSANRGEDL